MKKYILIQADVNDGDYINFKHEISDEDIELINPIIQAIKEFNDDKSIIYQKYNWCTFDHKSHRDPHQYMSPEKRYLDTGKCSQEAFDYFNDLLPCIDNEDIYTIESIEILVVQEEIKLL